MIKCYCGDCPDEIPRAIDFDYWCIRCAEAREIYTGSWEDNIELGFTYCTGCGKHGHVAVLPKEGMNEGER